MIVEKVVCGESGGVHGGVRSCIYIVGWKLCAQQGLWGALCAVGSVHNTAQTKSLKHLRLNSNENNEKVRKNEFNFNQHNN